MNEDDVTLIDSPLQQTYIKDGKSVNILIYRLADTKWTLELVDSFGNSTVWDDQFNTDNQALNEALSSLEEEGIDAFIEVPK